MSPCSWLPPVHRGLRLTLFPASHVHGQYPAAVPSTVHGSDLEQPSPGTFAACAWVVCILGQCGHVLCLCVFSAPGHSSYLLPAGQCLPVIPLCPLESLLLAVPGTCPQENLQWVPVIARCHSEVHTVSPQDSVTPSPSPPGALPAARLVSLQLPWRPVSALSPPRPGPASAHLACSSAQR